MAKDELDTLLADVAHEVRVLCASRHAPTDPIFAFWALAFTSAVASPDFDGLGPDDTDEVARAHADLAERTRSASLPPHIEIKLLLWWAGLALTSARLADNDLDHSGRDATSAEDDLRARRLSGARVQLDRARVLLTNLLGEARV